jgi:hypothetical protein
VFCFLLPVTLFLLTQVLLSCPYTFGIDDYISRFFDLIGWSTLRVVLILGLLSLLVTIPLYLAHKGYSGLRVFTMTLLMWVLILGVLSMYLASMNSSRDKGLDARVRSELHNISAEMERTYTEELKFGVAGGDCSSWTIPQSILNSLKGINMTPVVLSHTGLFCTDTGVPISRDVRCYADTESYAVSARIQGVAGPKFYCIDSEGHYGEQSVPIDGPTCEE